MQRNLIKKNLADFVKDETGEISKDKILKVGLATISALGILSSFASNAMAQHTSYTGGAVATAPTETCAQAHRSHVSAHNSY